LDLRHDVCPNLPDARKMTLFLAESACSAVASRVWQVAIGYWHVGKSVLPVNRHFAADRVLSDSGSSATWENFRWRDIIRNSEGPRVFADKAASDYNDALSCAPGHQDEGPDAGGKNEKCRSNNV
jgi:hypothetical protein